jgi:hypothetical protein
MPVMDLDLGASMTQLADRHIARDERLSRLSVFIFNFNLNEAFIFNSSIIHHPPKPRTSVLLG